MRLPTLYLVIGSIALIVSGIAPFDRGTWVLETFPVMIAIPLLVATAHRFPLTPLSYTLILIHALILILGGHYTYANVPLGFWVQELFGLARNHYDRLGHFAQGYVPAILARELLIRTSPLEGSRWLGFLVICVCLAFSACYELIEWWAALILGQGAEAFLGTQGDTWDTQWDMCLAGCGALIALTTLSSQHDQQLQRLTAHRR